MKHFAKLSLKSVLLCVFSVLLLQDAFSQVTLTGTSYSENFDGVGTSLPNGWTVRTGATSTVLGTVASFTTAQTAWNSATGTFRNSASWDGLTSSTTSTNQNASADRVVCVRQTGAFGDPGAAFVFQLNNTTGLTNFALSFKLQGLDGTGTNTRVTTWTIDYGIGTSPTSFTTLTTGTITASSFTNTTINATLNALANNPNPIWIRIVALSVTTGAGSRATTGIDDFSLTYAPVTPTLTATPTTIPAFNYVSGNGPSTAGSYTLSGSVLTPIAGDITITAPADFEISKTSSTTGFADNLAVSYTGGAFMATTIYARLKAGLAIGTFGLLNITHSGGGVTTPPTVTLSGSVTAVPPPVITTTGTLSTFNTIIGTPSASQPYTVSGVDLVSDITITAPTDFEIKTSTESTYANILNLTPTSGNVPTTTIDVRLKGTTAGTFSGNITHAATNISPDINVAVNGVVGAECGTSIDIATVRNSIPPVNSFTGTMGTIISGTVTAIFGANKFYLQDATGGIAVFTTSIVTNVGLILGDQVKITGTSGRRNGEAQISIVTCVTKISTGTVPAPVIFDSNTPPSGIDLNTFLATNEGKLIKIISTNVLSTGTFSSGTSGTNYSTTTCNSQGGTEIRVDPGSGTLIGSTIPTVTQDITGIVGRFITTDGGTDKYQIFPRSSSDLVNSATTCTVSGGCGVATFTDSPTQLDVFNWNIEWLGHPTNGPSQSGTNDATQIANAISVLNGVGADVYMLQEICQYNPTTPTDNTTAFGKLIEGLNTRFGANTYSGECSSAVSGSVADANPQRVCIIYKNSVVTKVFSRPMFNGFTPATYPPTGTPSQFWASGRKPFMFMAKVNINSQVDTILLVGLHAKAGSAIADYNRRKYDVRAMYDSLQTQYPTRKTMVVGDLNDDVDRSIASTASLALVSSYAPFLYVNPDETVVNGTRPSASWDPISKTLSDAFCASTVSFPDYIDHQIISNEMSGNTGSGFKYVPASVTSLRPAVPNYATTTSDHYATIARFQYQVPTITSIATGNWSSPTTWSCNCVPTSTDNVVIDTPHSITVDAASQAKSINLKGIINYLAPFVLSLGQ